MKRTEARGLVATFPDLAPTLCAVRGLQEAGFADLMVYSPAGHHEIVDEVTSRVSPVRLWTLLGGLLGCASGFALTIYTSLDWPLRTSAKPIVSLPPFVIIAFELTILLGALGAMLGFVLNARLPRLLTGPVYDARFSEGRFGIYVPGPERIAKAEEILRGCGAEEVRLEGA
ncbi:MAG: DUF3341 domain-containing protein [Terriglobia bacterium]